MTEHRERLRATLDELHAELANVGEINPEAREHLTQTLDEIQQALARTQTAPPGTARPQAPADEPPTDADRPGEPGLAHASQRESLIEQLGQSARHFEESHPTLSGIIGSLIDALGRMGI